MVFSQLFLLRDNPILTNEELHDLAKELAIEEQIAICRENGDPELDSAVCPESAGDGRRSA